MAVEGNFQLSFDKRMARVLVELDVTAGLSSVIDVKCNDHIFKQRRNYLHFPSAAISVMKRGTSDIVVQAYFMGRHEHRLMRV